ncbi:MAG: 4-(cytidine 5'-diphospho)-2-C-methyl-D-erythritol kinase, partial [Bacteroidales bacterium]|nr:4-(cytidine 5'-diphospho)-2-C-methyl-D-erythritol kinase [Bacteroidales bacterium]
MVLYPNPKINIGLFVVAERVDGFHDIETVFYPLTEPTDTLEIEPVEHGIDFAVTNADIGSIDNNLCVRAFRALHEACGFKGGVRMRLTKHIPVGAGLGGGSSDAAAVLNATNSIYGLNLNSGELKEIAAGIGSDVPFFIDNRPAFATGKGEKLIPIDLDLAGKRVSLIKPPFSMSTAEAYKAIESKPAPFDLRQLSQLPISKWKQLITNDFEKPLFEKFPVLAAAKERLYAAGADFVLLS